MAVDLMRGDLVRHPVHGAGRVTESRGFGENQTCTVSFSRSGRLLSVPRAEIEPLTPGEAAGYELVMLAVAELRRDDSSPIPLAERWRGGEVVLKPGDSSLAAKTIPLDTFFHKIVMVRDRLRVLEQHLNAHKGLGDAEKVELQQYITRVYGSLTTFNVLFADRDDWFVGQKSGEE